MLGPLVLVGDLIVIEVLQGFRTEGGFRKAQAVFANFEVSSMVGRDIAIAAAHNYRSLRQRGITPRSTIDTIIATFCLLNGHDLLHDDRDFDAFEKHLGLQVVVT